MVRAPGLLSPLRTSALLVRGQYPACLEEEREQLQQLRGYLNAHGPLTAEEIAEQTGIPLDRVLRCRRCGWRISMGVLRPACRTAFLAAVRELRAALDRLRETAPPRRRRVRREEPKDRFDLR